MSFNATTGAFALSYAVSRTATLLRTEVAWWAGSPLYQRAGVTWSLSPASAGNVTQVGDGRVWIDHPPAAVGVNVAFSLAAA
jgi:hypothetical protein